MKMAQGTDLVICEVSSDRISLSYHASLAILKVFARVSQQSLDVLVPCFEQISTIYFANVWIQILVSSC